MESPRHPGFVKTERLRYNDYMQALGQPEPETAIEMEGSPDSYICAEPALADAWAAFCLHMRNGKPGMAGQLVREHRVWSASV
jgi:hypothetical protein